MTASAPFHPRGNRSIFAAVTTPIDAWPRPRHARTDAVAQVDLFCFSPGPLGDAPMSALKYGLPGQAAMEGLAVHDVPRAADPAWFDAFRGGALRNVAASQLGPALKDLDAAGELHVVQLSKPDPADLTHLQAAWAVAKWLVDRGVTVVLDAHAQRFWKADELNDWPAARPFALSAEVSVLVEDTPQPDGTYLVHTRGMKKLARPDLVALGVPKEKWDQAGALLRTLALTMAGGVVLRAGETTREAKTEVRLEAYAPPGNAPQLHLNNDGLLVQDLDGPGLGKTLASAP